MYDLLSAIPFTINRANPDEGYYKDGEYVRAGMTTIQARGSIQPWNQSGYKRANLPEGASAIDTFVIYTRTPMIGQQLNPPQEPDRVVINGRIYYAWNVMDWSLHSDSPIAHFEVVMVMEDEGKVKLKSPGSLEVVYVNGS